MVDVPSNFTTSARFEAENTQGQIGVGSFSSSLEFAGDEDWIQVRLVAGQQFAFTLHALDPVTGSGGAALTVLNGAGATVAFANTGGVGSNVVLSFTPSTSGMFFVSVTGLESNPTDYVVTVSDWTLAKVLRSDGPDFYFGGASERILGGGGNDALAAGNNGEAYGDQGDDTISTGANGISAFGGLGNDTVEGGANQNQLFGDAGNDTLRGFGDIDRMFGGPGNDFLDGGVGSDMMFGGDGNDSVFGNGDNDTQLFGGGGNDVMNGGAGADVMTGEGGNDSYVVDNISDKVSELFGSGVDLVISSIAFSLANSARVFGLFENLTLMGPAPVSGTGNNAANTITGNAAANLLTGGIGNDRLIGGNGNDTLIGGVGIDSLTGGANNDSFVLSAPLSAANRDTVTDFNHVNDVFRLENAVMPGLGGPGGLSGSRFFAGAAAHDPNDRVVYNKATGALTYDSNGNAAGGATLLATLLNKPVLDVSDFVVI